MRNDANMVSLPPPTTLIAAAAALSLFAFTFSVFAEQPDRYVEWIGHSSAGPKLDTGYVFKVMPRIEIGMTLSCGDVDVAGNATRGNNYIVMNYLSNGTGFSYVGFGGPSGKVTAVAGVTVPSLDTETFNDVVWSTNFYYNGIHVATVKDAVFSESATDTFKLFTARNHTQTFTMKVSYLRMYDGGVLVRDMLPAKKDGEYGMYDSVEDAFHGNYGTGEFDHGADLGGEDSLLIDSDGVKAERPSPGYGYVVVGAGNRRTLRAPKLALSDGTVYRCTGWKLYDSVSLAEFESEPVETGTGNVYEYVHPDPEKLRRFVWCWEAVADDTVVRSVADGEWDAAATWSSDSVPTAADDVVVEHGVHCSGDVAAKSITVASGANLRFHASTSYTIANSTPDAPGDGGFSFTVAEDLSVLDGGLALHGGRTTPVITNLEISVGGDFLVFGSSLACVAAAAYDGTCVDITNLYNTATTVEIGGDFVIGDTSTLYPVADQKVGSPVRFRCGNFSLAESAVVAAQERGWHLNSTASVDPRTRFYGRGSHYSFAPGCGVDGNGGYVGGGYGGEGSNADGRSYGHAYGFKYAPYLPGSNSGDDGGWSDNYGNGSAGGYTRGGGVFWMTATNKAEIAGKIRAYAVKAGWQAASGGSVWLNAKTFEFGESASIDVHGGDYGGSTPTCAGGGGRISLAEGLSEAELRALAVGEEPAGLLYAESITAVACEVRAGETGSTPSSKPGDGTTTYVSKSGAVYLVRVAGVPLQAGAPDPAYGDYLKSPGDVFAFSADRHGVDPDNATWRYECLGYIVSNAVDAVATGDTTSGSYTVGDESVSVNWLWGEREYCNYLKVSGPGGVTVDGIVYTADTNLHLKASSPCVYTAVADDGAEFLYWAGDVPNAFRHSVSITLPAAGQYHPRAVFRTSAGGSAEWKADADGDFLDADNWVGGVMPSRTGEVLIGSGVMRLPEYCEVGSLTMTGGLVRAAVTDNSDGLSSNVVVVTGDLVLGNEAKMQLGVTDGSSVRYHSLRVGGDLTLGGTAELLVAAGRRTGAYTWKTGCGFVDVGGDFTLSGSSVFRPNCDGYYGGGVKTTVAGAFTVGVAAKVDADGLGNGVYYWPGWTAGIGDHGSIGPSHGGYGSSNGGTSHTASGSTYDYLYAPMMPGQQNRTAALQLLTRGGGTVRVEAGSMLIDGTVTANGLACGGGNTSGGSIWLLAHGPITVGAEAVLSAKGAYDASVYPGGGAGGGGRISLCRNFVLDRYLPSLLASPNAIPDRVNDVTDAFLAAHPAFTDAEYPDLALPVAPGDAAKSVTACWGSFKVLDGALPGLLIIVR